MTPIPAATPTPRIVARMNSDRKPAAIRSHIRPYEDHDGAKMKIR
jgi:hypothetical protein